jgi:hypothetical protein
VIASHGSCDVQEFLRSRGIDILPESLARMLQGVVENLRQIARVEPGGGLPRAEREALRAVGFTFKEQDLGAKDPVARAAAEMTALLATSLTAKQAAEGMGVDPSRVRQRLADRTLYGVLWKHRWRLPLFQFHEGASLAGLERVLPELSTDLSPIAVERWFLRPSPDLHSEELGRDLSPREWLLAGLPPEKPARVARHL